MSEQAATGTPEAVAPGASAETAYPVREVSRRMAEYVKRIGRLWVEGQVAECSPRSQMVFITLRDPEAEFSIKVVSTPAAVAAAKVEVGSRVVADVGVEWWGRSGATMFRAHTFRPVGEGELHARIERLRRLLADEGLFDVSRKRPLPALPGRVGLICGRNSDAMHDVVENARKRWPHVQFDIAEVAVQGPTAVSQVTQALREFEANRAIDVIVIARGGGAFEDLLPFSDEGLLRAVSACFTPVVSAIGHEQDRPLLDDVADVRASTPTDAARRITPDMAAELDALARVRQRNAQRVLRALDREHVHLGRAKALLDRAHPARVIDQRLRDVLRECDQLRRTALVRIERAGADLATARARLRALSPQATLERGFAVVRLADGDVVTDPRQLGAAPLHIRVAHGAFRATPILEAEHG